MFNKYYDKAFNNKSKNKSIFWKIVFYFAIIRRIMKWIFAKPKPIVDKQINLQPGEYKIKVTDRKSAGK
jgi:hypothetical protein